MIHSAHHSLKEAVLHVDGVSFHSSFLRSQMPRIDNLTAVVMHGAGESDSLRHAGLATLFAHSGISVVSLDFMGHGKTGGRTTDGSLPLRSRCVVTAIEHWTSEDTPLILCGFSMSGHVVLRLLSQLESRVTSVGLFCPATYAADAEDVPFGPDFTSILRTPDSWRSSLGLADASRFTGRAAVIVGSLDTVIPWEVVMEIVGTLKSNASEVRLDVIGGVGHQLAVWLSDHRTFSEQLVAYLAGEVI